ncbi:MAG: hypothetical protein AB1393_05150 [Candidatus Edwardsbacteria bacterium]
MNSSQNHKIWHFFGFIVGDALPAERIELFGVIIEPISSEKQKLWIKGPSCRIEFPGNLQHGFAIIPPDKEVYSQHFIYCNVTMYGDDPGLIGLAQKTAELKIQRAVLALSIAIPDEERCRFKLTRVITDSGHQSGACSPTSWFRIYKKELFPMDAIKNIRAMEQRSAVDPVRRTIFLGS